MFTFLNLFGDRETARQRDGDTVSHLCGANEKETIAQPCPHRTVWVALLIPNVSGSYWPIRAILAHVAPAEPGDMASPAWRGEVFFFFKAKEQQERSSIDQLCSQPPVVVPCLLSLSLMCFPFLYFSLVPLFTISLRVWVPGPRKQQVSLGYRWPRLL